MSSIQRLDPHTLRNLRPEDYRFIGAFDNEPERDCDDYLDQPERHPLAGDIAAQLGNAPAIAAHWRARFAAEAMPDGHWNTTDSGGRCDHCGARLRYVAVLEHRPTAQLVPVGETCLEHRFGDDTVDYLDLVRGYAAVRRERLAWRAQRITWLDADPRHAAAITYLHARTTDRDLPVSAFADSIATRWQQPATVALTPRQVDAVLRMRDQEAARRTAGDRAACDAPEGRQRVAGVVVRAKERDGFHGRPEVKLTVRDDRGFDVWITCTAAVTRALGTNPDVYPGARLAFTAELHRSERDSGFAFGRRPSQLTATPATSTGPARPTVESAPAGVLAA